MEQQKLSIEDGSNDKRYFTLIPNYILNHSTLWDREVYIQMKRIAGENGVCWTSQKTLANQCGVSVNRLKKSIKYLLDHKWIRDYGTKRVGTKGGTQEVNQYKITDLWKLNTDYYHDLKGVSPDDTTVYKRGVTDEVKGVSPGDDKEEHLLKKNMSFFEKNLKPTYNGLPMRFVKAKNKWYVIRDNEWLEYADKIEKIKWQPV